MGPATTSNHLVATSKAASSTLRLCWELVASRRNRGADPLVELRRPEVLDALARLHRPQQALRIAVVIELWPAPLHDIQVLCTSMRKTAAALRARGIGFDLWPQLDDDDRFLNTRTARVFSERLLPVLEALRDVELGVFLDMEPSLSTLEGVWGLQNGARLAEKARGLSKVFSNVVGSVWDARQGLRDLKELARDIAGFSFPVIAATPPPVLPLDAFGADAIKRFVLGCPEDDEGGAFFRTAALCYAPMLRHRGVDRAGQHRALSLWAARHREKSDAICVGPLSTGLLGDEPVYLSPEHLRQDLGAVRALGFSDVTVYSAEGLLFGEGGDPDAGLREDFDVWVEALIGAPVLTTTTTTAVAA